MPEAAAPIAPVSAVATNTDAGKAAPEAKAEPKKAAQKFDSKVEETLWQVNNPTADEVEDAASMSEIIDKAQEAAGKPSKEANQQSEEPEVPKEPPTKKKYKVGDKEYELDQETADRFVQKGIYLEKKNAEIAKNARDVKAREQAAEAREREASSLLEAIKTQSFDVLVELHGEEKAREMAEGWLRPRIEREMMPPEQRQQMEWQERAERAEARIAESEKTAAERKLDEQSNELKGRYEKTIFQALEVGGVPKTDFTAAEMAQWMSRGLDKGIEYEPEQLAQFVKEDNILRVGAMTENYVSAIETAKKSGDAAAIIKAGEGLVQLLGEPVMYAIGKYHLAKMKSGQPGMPPKIIETPRSKPPQETQTKRMTEDEYKAERLRRVAAMERGEPVSDNW